MDDANSRSVPKLELPPTELDREQKDVSPSRRSRFPTSVENTSTRTTSSNPSPTRSTSIHTSHTTTPSVAAVQRAISASKSSHASLDGALDSTKDRLQRSGQTTPVWPTSPRLKSPPPSTIRSMLPRRTDIEHTQPNTSTKRLASVSTPELGAAIQVQQESTKEQQGQGSLRPGGRVAGLHGHGLETVAESSLPTTPSFGPSQPPRDSVVDAPPLEETSETSVESSNSKTEAPTSTDGGQKSNPARLDPTSISAPPSRAPSNSRPETNLAKRSFTSLTGPKSKSAIEPLRTMTIETETVNSTPQVIGDRSRDAGGSIRTRTSNETIRPKKEKRKPTRKAPSLHAGTATSKADIFEAKVASAVDEADSSDSDETFVYESNPPEPRQNRHHSRTPSATSVASQVDYYGGRSKHGVRSGSNAIPGKRSMKFSSSLYGGQLDVEGSGGDGGRSSTRTHSSTPRPHHIGRYGRNGHASIIDGDSPFTQANRIGSPRTPTTTNLRSSRPDSPRLSNGRLANSSRKGTTGGYDTYDDGADDERAPLVGSVRVNRTRHGRRSNGQFRSMDFDEEEPGCWARFGGCMLLGLLVVLVCLGISTFVMALNRPLLDVEVKHVQNVLASEQELMLDLHVTATNPNLFAIAVNELDIIVFAESPYAGTSEEWEKYHPPLKSTWMDRRREDHQQAGKDSFWFPPVHEDDGIDEGTDPIDEEPGPQKMLLGHIFYFDSPLMFDASPLRHNPTSSVGEVRLTQPGNMTEIGGSARWERVLQHPFDLIVRGVIKYQLPLSSRTRSAKIGGRVKVSPDSDDGDDDKKKERTTLPPA